MNHLSPGSYTLMLLVIASLFMTQRFIWVKSPEAISVPSPPLLPQGDGDSWALQPIFWSSSSDFNWLTQIPYINMESVWRTIIMAYLAYKSYLLHFYSGTLTLWEFIGTYPILWSRKCVSVFTDAPLLSAVVCLWVCIFITTFKGTCCFSPVSWLAR